MRLKETEKMCGFHRSHIYAMMKAGQFPQRKRIGRRAVGGGILSRSSSGLLTCSEFCTEPWFSWGITL
ncbi:MAG: AlpA family phage regulatory protein [Pseudomonas sp.]|uniref:AlpA family phage regulatory protein n=1 Tax=Pseudomonas sp. TaxID=306 RepID=UPI003D09FD31